MFIYLSFLGGMHGHTDIFFGHLLWLFYGIIRGKTWNPLGNRMMYIYFTVSINLQGVAAGSLINLATVLYLNSIRVSCSCLPFFFMVIIKSINWFSGVTLSFLCHVMIFFRCLPWWHMPYVHSLVFKFSLALWRSRSWMNGKNW